jgi:hypothetical protein
LNALASLAKDDTIAGSAGFEPARVCAGRDQVANIKIAIVNNSTVVKQAEVAPVVAALQQQVHRDFAPFGASMPTSGLQQNQPISPLANGCS